MTSWTKFSLGSSKPRRSRFPLGERPRRLLLRNSPRADELSSFSPQATGPDDSRFGVPLAILRSSCIPQRQSAAFQCLEPSRGAGSLDYRVLFASHTFLLLEISPCVFQFVQLVNSVPSPAHNDVSTTMIYTHVLNRGGKGVRSPLDGLTMVLRPGRVY